MAKGLGFGIRAFVRVSVRRALEARGPHQLRVQLLQLWPENVLGRLGRQTAWVVNVVPGV